MSAARFAVIIITFVAVLPLQMRSSCFFCEQRLSSAANCTNGRLIFPTINYDSWEINRYCKRKK